MLVVRSQDALGGWVRLHANVVGVLRRAGGTAARLAPAVVSPGLWGRIRNHSLHDTKNLFNDTELERIAIAEDLAVARPPSVTTDQSAREALDLLVTSDLDEIAVLNQVRQVIGYVSKHAILDLFKTELQAKGAEEQRRSRLPSPSGPWGLGAGWGSPGQGPHCVHPRYPLGCRSETPSTREASSNRPERPVRRTLRGRLAAGITDGGAQMLEESGVMKRLTFLLAFAAGLVALAASAAAQSGGPCKAPCTTQILKGTGPTNRCFYKNYPGQSAGLACGYKNHMGTNARLRCGYKNHAGERARIRCAYKNHAGTRARIRCAYKNHAGTRAVIRCRYVNCAGSARVKRCKWVTRNKRRYKHCWMTTVKRNYRVKHCTPATVGANYRLKVCPAEVFASNYRFKVCWAEKYNSNYRFKECWADVFNTNYRLKVCSLRLRPHNYRLRACGGALAPKDYKLTVCNNQKILYYGQWVSVKGTGGVKVCGPVTLTGRTAVSYALNRTLVGKKAVEGSQEITLTGKEGAQGSAVITLNGKKAVKVCTKATLKGNRIVKKSGPNGTYCTTVPQTYVVPYCMWKLVKQEYKKTIKTWKVAKKVFKKTIKTWKEAKATYTKKVKAFKLASKTFTANVCRYKIGRVNSMVCAGAFKVVSN